MAQDPLHESLYVPANSGRDFAWKSDHAYVKINSEESGGRYSLIEDNLTTEFHLPRHLHHEHAESFYVVHGKVEFRLDDRTVTLSAGDFLFVPPGQPHEALCIEPAKMLTLYQPAGLEKLFEGYAAMTPEDLADPEKVKALDLANDNIVL